MAFRLTLKINYTLKIAKQILLNSFIVLAVLGINLNVNTLYAHGKNNVSINNGILDLSNLTLDNDKIIELSGNWEFYWAQFLSPEDFSSGKNIKPTGYLKIPGLWNNYEINGITLSGEGFATLRLIVHAPQFKGKKMQLKLGRVETAYKIFIDNVLAVHVGNIDLPGHQMEAAWKTAQVNFVPADETFQIVMQIKNFKHRKGGVSNSITMGTQETLTSDTTQGLAIEMFLIGVLIIMALHHFGLFSLRLKDVAALNFGLLCLFTAMAMLTTGELLLTRAFPSFNWEWVVKLNFITNYIRLAAFALFISLTFSHFAKISFAKAIAAGSFTMSIFVILTEARVNSHTLIVFILMLVAVVIYMIYVMIRAYTNKHEGAGYAIWGTITLCLAALNDVLVDAHLLNTPNLSHIGTFVFIFSQSFMLSLRSSKSFLAVEKLSTRLLSLDTIKNEFLKASGHQLNTPLEVIVKNVGAQKGYLILRKENRWKIEIEATMGGRSSRLLNDFYFETDMKFAGEYAFSHKVVLQTIETKESVLLYNAEKNLFYENDPYVKANHALSIVCMPLMNKGTLAGIIYLENNAKIAAFDDETQSLLDLLSSQTASLIDNALMYRELAELNAGLEEKVKERTAEVMVQKEEIEAQRDEIEKSNAFLQQTLSELSVKNRDLTDSINYSKRIQESILPSDEYIKELFPNSFVYFKPRDVLSGDFYWFEQVFASNKSGGAKSEIVIAAAIDCTGHGVPGALMSIIANDLLNYAVHELGLSSPAEILNALQDGIKTKLKQKDRKSSQDGLDIAIICYQRSKNIVQFAGAKNPIIIVHDGNAQIIEGDRLSIGGLNQLKSKQIQNFTNHTFSVHSGDRIYLLTDGVFDQFGGENERKFGRNRFIEMVQHMYPQNFETQKQFLTKTIHDWKGDGRQIDDMLIIGIEI